MAGDKKKTDRREDSSVLEREKTKKPRKHKVLLHNDDFTPMEFVILILQELFHKSPAEASRIMLLVHQTGLGVAGAYSREVAESKVAATVRLARDAGYPLLATTEPE